MKRYSDTVTPARDTVLLYTLGIPGIVVVFIANLFGWWWITVLVGLVLGMTPWRSGRPLLLAIAVGAVGWALGLLWLALNESVLDAARVVAGIMGFGEHASLVILLTLVLGALLALAGAWLGIAARHTISPRFTDPFGQL